MKKILYSIICAAISVVSLTSCNDWLDVKPNNEQVTTDYWTSKEEVEAVLGSAYYQMRNCVPTIIKWGELRGGAMYTTSGSDAKLQDFNMTATNNLCKYDNIYKVIGYANSILHYAPGVRANDNTYYESVLNSHLAEAYFLRAYCYLLLVKNYKEVPLVVEAYVDDTKDFNIPKATEEEIVAQIKSDVKAALDKGAAKGTYEEEWQTKGRATKWALYALMADVCLWSGDYATCKEYCDKILDAKDTFRPAFMTRTVDWYTIFYPGNSNESIFEINWDYDRAQETNNFSTSLFPQSSSAALKFTDVSIELMTAENEAFLARNSGERNGRMYLATFVGAGSSMYLWKYYGNDIADTEGGARTHQDANFIIYRVAEIILMKAQALAMEGNYKDAITEVNKILKRAGLEEISTEEAQFDEQSVLETILEQKQMEFMGEGKRWYDVLWFSRVNGGKYKDVALDMICNGNQTTKPEWIRSVLTKDYAWYMPLPQEDIEHNQRLEQNPAY